MGERHIEKRVVAAYGEANGLLLTQLGSQPFVSADSLCLRVSFGLKGERQFAVNFDRKYRE